MCDLCQIQFGFDHDTSVAGNIPCPRCGRFYVDPEQRECYHCFSRSSGLEECDRCREGEGRTAKLQ